jgi:hypothetical protein
VSVYPGCRHFHHCVSLLLIGVSGAFLLILVRIAPDACSQQDEAAFGCNTDGISALSLPVGYDRESLTVLDHLQFEPQQLIRCGRDGHCRAIKEFCGTTIRRREQWSPSTRAGWEAYRPWRRTDIMRSYISVIRMVGQPRANQPYAKPSDSDRTIDNMQVK